MKTSICPRLLAWPWLSLAHAGQPGAARAPQASRDQCTDAQELLARGEYLVRDGRLQRLPYAGYAGAQGKVDKAQWLTGSPVGFHGPWGTTYPSNLRLRMAEMDEAQWLAYSADLHTRPMMPDFAVRAMHEDDRRAIYRFARSLGAAGEPAPAYLPPGQPPPAPYYPTGVARGAGGSSGNGPVAARELNPAHKARGDRPSPAPWLGLALAENSTIPVLIPSAASAMLRVTKLTDYATVVLTVLAAEAGNRAQRVGTGRTRRPGNPDREQAAQAAGPGRAGRGLPRRPWRLPARPQAEDIGLIEIVEAMEGPLGMTECSLHAGNCGIEHRAACAPTGARSTTWWSTPCAA